MDKNDDTYEIAVKMTAKDDISPVLEKIVRQLKEIEHFKPSLLTVIKLWILGMRRNRYNIALYADPSEKADEKADS